MDKSRETEEGERAGYRNTDAERGGESHAVRVDSRLAMTPLVWSVGLPPRGGRVSECAALDSDGDAFGSRCCVPCHCSSFKITYLLTYSYQS